MKPEFDIAVDVPRDLVRITMLGFFAADDIARFVDARDRAVSQLKCGPNQHCTLVDIRGMDIQAQESVSRFQSVLADPAKASRRLAFVVARSLARMQAKRAADSRDAGYFETLEDAEAWLMEK
ncbi:hypothetical protein M0208_18245 [Sphingomonas sp. SUN019]|uniref:hypothetical protein n=1 Tax=Sphingomonas sp. SUN019 TaxID=2937788 RepID=UPI002164AF82|nr:hypothetical protein [Sphingomonas sp. SUN019]UVO52354.1 hypothetical protein M0208_18245 [Sphingomonas sp. SUN019]